MKFFSLSLILIAAFSLGIPAVHADTIAVSGALPGSYATSSGPGAFVANFYQFALMIGGLLAFGMIVWGGVKYAASRGNPSAESDAKDRIYGALIGLLLLAGVYLILFTINPNLINLNLTALPTVTITASPSGSSLCPPTSITCGTTCCNQGQTCTPAGAGYVCQSASMCQSPKIGCGTACCNQGQKCVVSGTSYLCQ